jgi:hypothetical protein
MVGFEKKFDNSKMLYKALQFLDGKAVYVGVSDGTDARKDNGPTNAELAFLHTNGVPTHNIPPRPFLEPAIKANHIGIGALQTKVVEAASKGNQAEVNIGMQKIGIFAVNCVKQWWDDPRNNWPPNAPSTIARKGSSHPLLDTAQLKNAQTYVIQ